MPRRLENDKWLFGVTLGLCLLGAVMIFSASAVTAEHEYGHSYFFLLRQSAWLAIGLAGMSVSTSVGEVATRSFLKTGAR